MKQKFLVLKTIEASALQLATIRSLLHDLTYIEIDKSFFVSCNKSTKDSLSAQLSAEKINYILVYVNIKDGCDLFANGINENDKKTITKIVTN